MVDTTINLEPDETDIMDVSTENEQVMPELSLEPDETDVDLGIELSLEPDETDVEPELAQPPVIPQPRAEGEPAPEPTERDVDFQGKAQAQADEMRESFNRMIDARAEEEGITRGEASKAILRELAGSTRTEEERLADPHGGMDPAAAAIMGALSLLPEDTGSEWLLNLSEWMTVGTGWAGDKIEAGLKQLKEDQPSMYAAYLSDMDPTTATRRIGRDINAILDISDILGASPGQFIKAGKVAGRSADDARRAISDERLQTLRAQLDSSEKVEAANTAAKNLSEQNKDLRDQLIRGFEEKTGRNISNEKDGHLEVDPEKAREAGSETLASLTDETNAMLGGEDALLSPILNPDKFDNLVAVTKELQDMYPDAFDPDKTIIDNLVDLTIDKDLLESKELYTVLGKYNLPFEDYILTVVGSGSQAGKVLNKLSQIRKQMPKNEALDAQRKAADEAAGEFRKAVMRIENVRRGGLVSQFATAMRNLTSGVVRMPLEGMANVMDTVIVAGQKGGLTEAAKTVVDMDNWKGSFRGLDYIFNDSKNAKEFVELVTGQPEMAKQYNLLFNNINEIHEITGRGTGTAFDKVLTGAEDLVDTLNVPNRWQEHLIRRGVFLSELERLVKQEYGLDFVDEVSNKGNLRAFMENRMTPEGQRGFVDLAADAVDKALSVTYAKQPDIPVFRSTSQFIVRNGLTVIMPFPRFMFNAMELMGQYAGGASIPLTRKVASIVTGGKVGKGPLTAKDRERITRNMMGMAAIAAAYKYRSQEDMPSKYYEVEMDDDGTVMDTRAQFPLAQFLYLGEATKRVKDGTFNDWFKFKDFKETFLGTNLRTGVGNSILEEVAALAEGSDLTKGENVGKAVGGALGQYLSTWAVPFGQLIDAERATGERTSEMKDVRRDPTLDATDAFTSAVERPFRSRGFGVTTEEEQAMPSREFLEYEDRKRVSPASKLLLGASLYSGESELGKFLGKMGLDTFNLGSRSRVPGIQRVENIFVRKALDAALPTLKRLKDMEGMRYDKKSDSYKERVKKDAHINAVLKKEVVEIVRDIKSDLNKDAYVKADDGTLDKEATAYARAMIGFRRTPPAVRRRATQIFIDKFDKEPEGGNVQDLQKLNAIVEGIK